MFFLLGRIFKRLCRIKLGLLPFPTSPVILNHPQTQALILSEVDFRYYRLRMKEGLGWLVYNFFRNKIMKMEENLFGPSLFRYLGGAEIFNVFSNYKISPGQGQHNRSPTGSQSESVG